MQTPAGSITQTMYQTVQSSMQMRQMGKKGWVLSRPEDQLYNGDQVLMQAANIVAMDPNTLSHIVYHCTQSYQP